MNLQKMMQQAQEMQRKIVDMQAKLETMEVEGNSGGGAVKLTMNGKNNLLRVSIDENMLKAEDKETLEDLIVAAHNDARGKIDSTMSDQMSGLNLPAGMKLPF